MGAAPTTPASVRKHGQIAFYIGAHEDDWQIFRGERAFRDLTQTDARVVFIYVTAGDVVQQICACENARPVPGIDKRTWWMAREAGALASLELVLHGKPSARKVSVQTSRGAHDVQAYDLGNTTSYFLRLGDGHLAAMQRGAEGADFRTVDGDVYKDWQDVVDVIGSILTSESSAFDEPNPWVNAPDYDFSAQRNPAQPPYGSELPAADNPVPPELQNVDWRDHPDHVATGMAVQSATQGKYRRVWWMGYGIAGEKQKTRAEEIPQPDYALRDRLVRAYTERVRELTGFDDWQCSSCFYTRWMTRTRCFADDGTSDSAAICH